MDFFAAGALAAGLAAGFLAAGLEAGSSSVSGTVNGSLQNGQRIFLPARFPLPLNCFSHFGQVMIGLEDRVGLSSSSSSSSSNRAWALMDLSMAGGSFGVA